MQFETSHYLCALDNKDQTWSKSLIDWWWGTYSWFLFAIYKWTSDMFINKPIFKIKKKPKYPWIGCTFLQEFGPKRDGVACIQVNHLLHNYDILQFGQTTQKLEKSRIGDIYSIEFFLVNTKMHINYR